MTVGTVARGFDLHVHWEKAFSPGSGMSVVTSPSSVLPGGTDATAAFNSALKAATGGTVSVPGSGVYFVSSVAVEEPGMTIVCTGTPAATIKLKALAPGDASPIFNVTANRFTLKNCILDGNRSVQPLEGFNDSFRGRSFRSGIRMEGWYTGLTVDTVTFQNFFGSPVATLNVSSISVVNSVFRDNYFEAVFVYNSYELGDASHFTNTLAFIANTITNTASPAEAGDVNANGLLVHQTSNIRIENNIVNGYERNAIKLENCRWGRVVHNRIDNGHLPNFAAIGLQNGAHHITVADNQISNAGTGIDTSLVHDGQYRPDTVEHLIVRRNTIDSIKDGSMPDGIRILGFGSATTNIVIADNIVNSVPRYGINVRQFRSYFSLPRFSRITIQNNRLTSIGSCAKWFADSRVSPTSVSSSGNTCR